MSTARRTGVMAIIVMTSRPVSACGVCMMAEVDWWFPPIALWCALAVSWFVSTAVVAAVLRTRLPPQPQLVTSAVVLVAASVVGVVGLGPFTVIPLVISPLIAFRRFGLPATRAWSAGGLRRVVLLVGIIHLAVAGVGVIQLVRTRATRTDAEYICQWPYTPRGLTRFKALRQSEPQSADQYRDIVRECRGPVVGEAAERLAVVGEARTDLPLLEDAARRLGDGDSSAEAIVRAIDALRDESH